MFALFDFLFNHYGLILALIIAAMLVWKSVVIVNGSEIAVLERKYFGSSMPQGRVVALTGEIGNRARTLGPGLHFLIPFLYATNKQFFTTIAENQVGLLESIDGDPIPAGKIFARVVEGHDAFQDGEGFLKNGGEKGPQIQILPPGTYRINPALFRVKKSPAVTVGKNEIALISSTDGSPIPPGKIFARVVSGHNAFQDGEEFLQNGGEKGPQIELLPPGTYRINLDLFNVRKVPVMVIDKGQIGLVTSMDGEPIPAGRLLAKKVEGHSNFENGQAFLQNGGQKGPQIDLLLPGTYRINTDLFHIEIKDATVVPASKVGLVTALDGEPLPEAEYVAKPVSGHNDFQNASSFLQVVIRVRPDQAPYMVSKIGSIENLILHVIHPMIDSSFRNQASSTSAMNFMQDRQEEQRKAEERARLELEKYHVECVSVLICQITLPQDLMDTQTKKNIAQQQQAMYQDQQKAEQTRIATEKTRAEADQQKNLVEAEIGVKIAEQNKEKAIRFAEGEAESIRLRAEGEAKGIRARGDAEGARILAMGEATAKAYELQNRAVGQQGVTAIEIAKQIAAGNIKVTPDFLVQGGDNLGGLVSAFLTDILVGKRQTKVGKPVEDVSVGSSG